MADDIDEIRKRKLEKMKEQAQNNNSAQSSDEQSEKESIETVLRKGLTDDARQRLNAVEMVKEERAAKVKRTLASLIVNGKVETPVDEEQVKSVLQKVADKESTDFDISRR